MAKQSINGAAEVKGLVGKELDPSEWKTLAFSDIKAFADATGDHQWIHVDKERCARESPYRVPIAHGYYTVARIAGLIFEVIELGGFKGAINYGLNKVRFPAPLKEGAVYRLKLNCASVTDIPAGVQCVYEATIEVKDQPKPACVAEVVFRYFV